MDGRARIAWNLRRLRGDKGLAQEALAADAGVAAPYLSRIERGTANPTVDVLVRLALALNVDVEVLLIRPDLGLDPPKPMKAGRKPKR